MYGSILRLYEQVLYGLSHFDCTELHSATDSLITYVLIVCTHVWLQQEAGAHLNAAKESLEKFIEKAKELSPRNIVPQIYITGGANETEKEKETFKERRDSICEFFFDEKLLGDVLFDVFIGSPNRIEIIIYWPRPEY